MLELKFSVNGHYIDRDVDFYIFSDIQVGLSFLDTSPTFI